MVDLHNQAWQAELALEKKWVTQNAFFSLVHNIVGNDRDRHMERHQNNE